MNYKSVIGHSKNIELLKKILETDRMPHALLFSGPWGIGKRLAAVSLAAAINCESRSEHGACGTCSSCTKLKAGNHPMVKFVGSPTEERLETDFIDGRSAIIGNIIAVDDADTVKKTIKINIYQVRQIIREASLKSFGFGKKIFIIDDVSEASTEALNCLLKVLEEPPEDTFLILITSKEEWLLPTIKSRCQRVGFSALDKEDMRRVIDIKVSEEVQEKQKEELIEISSGSPGRFFRFLEIENIVLSGIHPEDFFKEAAKWSSESSQCSEKLQVLLELEGIKFRRSPTREGQSRIEIIEDTLINVKKNANTDLSVSNMFLKLGALKI
ncbi:DNA polymerase III subunit [Elusimicrobiota bacterium]